MSDKWSPESHNRSSSAHRVLYVARSALPSFESLYVVGSISVAKAGSVLLGFHSIPMVEQSLPRTRPSNPLHLSRPSTSSSDGDVSLEQLLPCQLVWVGTICKGVLRLDLRDKTRLQETLDNATLWGGTCYQVQLPLGGHVADSRCLSPQS